MLITAVMMHKQRALVRAFEQAGATSEARAQTAEQLGLQPGMAWYRLVTHAVLRCPAEGRYFLDVGNWHRLRQRRRWLALAAVAVLFGCLGLILLLTRSG
ncbi:MAG: hypothetical protein ABI767_16870 [Rhodanobacter sp.]